MDHDESMSIRALRVTWFPPRREGVARLSGEEQERAAGYRTGTGGVDYIEHFQPWHVMQT